MFGWSTAHGEDDLVPRVEPDVVEEGHGEEEHHEDEPVVHDYVLCKWLNIREIDDEQYWPYDSMGSRFDIRECSRRSHSDLELMSHWSGRSWKAGAAILS